MATNTYSTAAGSIFITAADARQNPIRERVVFDEGTAISSAILEAVRTGFYNALVNDGTPMTQNSGVTEQVNAINDVTSTFNIPNHPYNTGDAVFVNSSGELPAPLQLSTLYYVIFVDADNIRLASTRQNALAARPINITLSSGISSIILTDQGSGYTATPSVTLVGGNATVAGTAQAYLAPYGNISYIVVGSNGNGYHYPPTVQIVSQGAGGTAGAVSFTAVSMMVNQGGQYYAPGDTLSVIGGTGQPAKAIVTSADANGMVETVIVSMGGSYTTLPSLSNVATSVTPGGGVGCTLDLNMGIGNIAIGSAGAQYTAPPLVTIAGGGGTGALAYTTVSAGSLNSIQVSAPGNGYISQPIVNITSGSSAAATAYLQPTGIGIPTLLNNGGNTYTSPPVISVEAPGTGATVDTVYMSMTGATLATGGAGSQYVVGDILIVSGGQGAASATIRINVVDSAGSIVDFTLITSGSYSQLPPMQGNAPYGGSGQAASFNLTAGLSAITLSSGGSGYTAPPTVIITPADGNGTGGSAYTLLSGSSVSSLVVTSPGLGYTAPPVVSITSGSGASIVASLTETSVQFVNVTNSGSGYTNATVLLQGQTGNGAQATANISGGQIVSITVTQGGVGYTDTPMVIITGDGFGATAFAQLTPTSLAGLAVSQYGNNYTSIPNVIIPGTATANVNLYSTGIEQVVVTNGGQGYSSTPQVNIIPGAGETSAPTAPSLNTIRGFSIQTIAIVDQGSGYQTVPDVQISAPDNLIGNAATATATIGYGTGTMTVIGYPASRDYFQVWQGGNALDPNQTRPYADRMGTIINYFQNLGYTITQQVNPNTNTTFQWNIQW